MNDTQEGTKGFEGTCAAAGEHSAPPRGAGVSRRSFLKGAATLVGAGAVAGLTGCAPAQAGGDGGSGASAGASAGAAADGGTAVAGTGATQTLDPSKAVWPVIEEFEIYAAGEGEIAFVAEPIDASAIVATHDDYDVVVCGLGPAGDAAALSCAEHGLKTIAVEKREQGNYNSATIGGTNSKIHQHWNMSFDTDAWLADAVIDSAFQGDITLYKHWLEKNGEAVDWYVSHFDNQNLDDYPLTFAAGDFPDFREQWDQTAYSRSWNTSINLPYPPGELAGILAGILEDAGVEIRYECPAVQLVTNDSGAVTGVIVKGAEGFEQYNVKKAVVLATGGYEWNVEMLKERCRPRGIPGHWLTASMGNTGDGHRMGLAVGAAEDDFPQAIMLDPEQLMPYLRVNALGKRFMAEYEPYGHLAMGIQAQPAAFDWYVVDEAIDTKIDKVWTPSSSCYGPKEVWVGAAKSPNAVTADTLEELAELMDVPADAFVETIDNWNAMAAAGKDNDYNFPGHMMMTIDTPPYYATKEYADGLCTVGGLLVNTDCQVLDIKRQPIEGLYACGLTSGGMFFNTYPHNLNCLSHTRNCQMGYTVGQVLSGA
jgi:succinate dehydrogenase/fumarate reductase flavoprotein subunit